MRTINNKDEIISCALRSLLMRLKCDEARAETESTLRQYGITICDKNGNDRLISDILSEMMIKLMNMKKKDRDFNLIYSAINLVGKRNVDGFILLYNDFVANNVFL